MVRAKALFPVKVRMSPLNRTHMYMHSCMLWGYPKKVLETLSSLSRNCHQWGLGEKKKSQDEMVDHSKHDDNEDLFLPSNLQLYVLNFLLTRYDGCGKKITRLNGRPYYRWQCTRVKGLSSRPPLSLSQMFWLRNLVDFYRNLPSGALRCVQN